MIEKLELVALMRGVGRVVKDHVAGVFAERDAIVSKSMDELAARQTTLEQLCVGLGNTLDRMAKLAAANDERAEKEAAAMADVFIKGLLEDFRPVPAMQIPPMNVNVNMVRPKSPVDGLRIAETKALAEMGEALRKLEITLKKPMRPVYDESGRLVGGERVESL